MTSAEQGAPGAVNTATGFCMRMSGSSRSPILVLAAVVSMRFSDFVLGNRASRWCYLDLVMPPALILRVTLWFIDFLRSYS
jgi:hypothetical protein